MARRIRRRRRTVQTGHRKRRNRGVGKRVQRDKGFLLGALGSAVIGSLLEPVFSKIIKRVKTIHFGVVPLV